MFFLTLNSYIDFGCNPPPLIGVLKTVICNHVYSLCTSLIHLAPCQPVQLHKEVCLKGASTPWEVCGRQTSCELLLVPPIRATVGQSSAGLKHPSTTNLVSLVILDFEYFHLQNYSEYFHHFYYIGHYYGTFSTACTDNRSKLQVRRTDSMNFSLVLPV